MHRFREAPAEAAEEVDLTEVETAEAVTTVEAEVVAVAAVVTEAEATGVEATEAAAVDTEAAVADMEEAVAVADATSAVRMGTSLESVRRAAAAAAVADMVAAVVVAAAAVAAATTVARKDILLASALPPTVDLLSTVAISIYVLSLVYVYFCWSRVCDMMKSYYKNEKNEVWSGLSTTLLVLWSAHLIYVWLGFEIF